MIGERLTAQLLCGPRPGTPEAVVERLLAVQAQDPRGARLSVRSRSIGLHAADVDKALSERHSLVVTWLNRGTLHLVAAEDYWWLQPLTTPQLVTANRRRLGQEGVSDAQTERGVEVITEAVGCHGPQTRTELRHRLSSAGVPTAGQALVHVLLAASLRGRVVRGPMRGKEHAFAAVADWLGDPPDPEARADGLARLARRYLAGHGPADARDLAKWAGLPLGDARRGFGRIRDEVTPGPEGLVDLATREGATALPPVLPPPRLLGPFDPLLLGWASRKPFVGDHTVVTTNGLFRPFALVDGRVVAIWSLRGSTFTVHLLESVAPEALGALVEDATDVLRFLGLSGPPDVKFVA